MIGRIILHGGRISKDQTEYGCLIYNHLIMSDSLNYSRKEIVNWVQSHSRYKFEDLKNGVFFCRMLAFKYPEESGKMKFNSTPVSQYDYNSNLSIMKRILTNHGLQLNLNIAMVLNSKNNFQLAKWFRKLMEDVVTSSATSTPAVENYSAELPRVLSSEKEKTENLREDMGSPKKHLQQSNERYKKKMESAQKSNKNKESQSKMKRLSMAKSEVNFLKEKRNGVVQLKIPMSRQRKDRRQDADTVAKLNKTQVTQKMQQIEYQVEGDIGEILYERALQQSIQSFKKILDKIRVAAVNSDTKTYAEFREGISKAIFSR